MCIHSVYFGGSGSLLGMKGNVHTRNQALLCHGNLLLPRQPENLHNKMKCVGIQEAGDAVIGPAVFGLRDIFPLLDSICLFT